MITEVKRGSREGKMANESRAISILIREAPADQSGIEFVKNVLDFKDATGLHVYPLDVRGTAKACYYNDGGMDEETMYSLGEIFGDPKEDNGKTDDNYNTGARVMGLKANEQGVVFVSQHKGVIRSCRVYLDEGVFKVEDNEEEWLTAFDVTPNDWVRVVLLGNSRAHNTFAKPYGNTTSKNPLLEQFTYKFWEVNKKIKVGNEQFVPLKKQFADSALVKWSVRVSKAVTIHYTVVPPKVKAVCGILVKNDKGYTQIFDAHYNFGRSQFAKSAKWLFGSLGALPMQKELSVLVELDESYGHTETQYRTDLQVLKTGKKIDLHTFAKEIVDYVPPKLRKLIDARADKIAKSELKAKSTALIKDVMNELGLDLTTLVARKNGQYETTSGGGKKKGKGNGGGNGGENDGRNKKPTPAERDKGVPKFKIKWNDDPEAPLGNWYELAPVDVGHVEGTEVYFNRKTSPFFRLAVDAVRNTQEGANENKSTIETRFAEFLCDQLGLKLAYEDVTPDGDKAVLITAALMALSSGEFVRFYAQSYTKKG